MKIHIEYIEIHQTIYYNEYTHLHLPEIDVLKRILSEAPEKIQYYIKYGALIGSTESMNYLKQKIDEYTKTTS